MAYEPPNEKLLQDRMYGFGHGTIIRLHSRGDDYKDTFVGIGLLCLPVRRDVHNKRTTFSRKKLCTL